MFIKLSGMQGKKSVYEQETQIMVAVFFSRAVFITIIVECTVATNQGRLLFTV